MANMTKRWIATGRATVNISSWLGITGTLRRFNPVTPANYAQAVA